MNTGVWLTELSDCLGRRATLDDIPDDDLDHFAAQGFDWIWILSVWQTGLAASAFRAGIRSGGMSSSTRFPIFDRRRHSRSGFAITGYSAMKDSAATTALARLHDRLRTRGLRLMLDFVPNHMALDHPWVEHHPEYFVAGTELDLSRAPQNYTRVSSQGATRSLPTAAIPTSRLARHAPTRLRQPGDAGGHGRRSW